MSPTHAGAEDVDLVFSLLTQLRQRVSLALAMTVRNLSLEECTALIEEPLGEDKFLRSCAWARGH